MDTINKKLFSISPDGFERLCQRIFREKGFSKVNVTGRSGDGGIDGEGILKGVNFLDAGFHVGVNTVGQSLRNANLNLRAEPPNPRVQVSPWMNTTIDEDLTRRPLGTEGVCNQTPPEYGLVQ